MEMWLCRRMAKTNWVEKNTNEKVLQEINEERDRP